MADITVPAASSGGGDVSVRIPAAVVAGGDHVPVAREGEGGAPAKPNPEKQLSRFVRCVAFGEWAGNAFGALAFVWATGVLLGGFCSSLNRQDFWFASVMIFIEAFRIFSRSYKLDSQFLFGTTRALTWINSSFPRMLGRPQEGDVVVLLMGLWLNLILELVPSTAMAFILEMALLIPWSRRPPRRPRKWQMRVVAIAYLLFAALRLIIGFIGTDASAEEMPSFLVLVLPVIIEAGAVLLLLNMRRPRGLANQTSTPCGRRLISLAKVISALLLAVELVMYPWEDTDSVPPVLAVIFSFDIPFAVLVLSLGSLQTDHAETSSLFGRWTDAIIHIFFIFHFLLPFPLAILEVFVPGLSPVACLSLSFVLLPVLLLIGNLQIPAAVAQIVLSSLRLSKLVRDPHMGYDPGSSSNMVAAIAVFYVLALCQGSLYVMASFLALFSWIPRRMLMRRTKLGGKLLGAKAIDLYYERTYATRMHMGVFGVAGSTMTFADFAVESLSSGSSSREVQVAGLCILHNMLQEPSFVREQDEGLVLRVTSSTTAVSTLVGMLAWTDDVVEHHDSYLIIRLFAARVTAELAGSLRIISIPDMLKLVSSLLKLAENTNDVVVVVVPHQQAGPGPQQTPPATGNGGCCSCAAIGRFWHRMKQKYWTVPEEPTFLLAHQDSSVPMLGMLILEKLARDLDNCAEILKDDTTNLISKTIGIIGLATSEDLKIDDALACSSLEFLRRLANTGEKIGAELRQELWNHPILLTCLTRVLEDDRNGSTHQVWEPAMDLIAKLALDKEAGLEIARNQVITARLLHAFLGKHVGTNRYLYDQSVRKVSGEALANLALWGTANCSAILEEPGYQVINDLTNMLSVNDQNRHVAASLLLNLCEHFSVNLLLSYPHASEQLSSALTTVMKHIMEAEGKQLECLINLASEIGDVSHEAFVQKLESQTNNGAELVQKLLCTLNSKKVPNPEYPRMRRVIVKIIISILKSCHRTVEKLMEQAMVEQLMESLSKIERSPSRVEEYRVFYGNIGVVPEDQEPMSTLVAKAKELLVQRTT